MTTTTSRPETSADRRRILLVNADHRVRDGLADLIGLADGIEVVARTGHTTVALDATRELRPDIVVLDPRLPETDDGLALIHRLRAARPSIRVVLLWSPECGDIEVFAAVADDCLDTCVDAASFSDTLIAAIRSEALTGDEPRVADSGIWS